MELEAEYVAPKKRKLKSFLGKQTLKFTRNRVISHLPHRQWQMSRRYSILGVDENSVAIIEIGEPRTKNRGDSWKEGNEIVKEFFSKPEIKHIHFDKSHFWVSIGNGRNREFYRKLNFTTSTSSTRLRVNRNRK